MRTPTGRRVCSVLNHGTSRLRRVVPVLALLATVILFHRRVVFSSQGTFPWDFQGYHLPQGSLMLHAFKNGEWPLWNPYIYCGHPFAANIQAEVFYPPRIGSILLALLLGERHLRSILEWELVLHACLAGAFAFLCGLRCGLRRDAALLAGIVFSLGGYFASQVEHIGAVEAAAWIPLVLAGLISWNQALSLRSLLEVSSALAMATLAGFTPVLLVLYVASPVIVLVLAILGRNFLRSALRLAGAQAASCLLSAIILLPAAELSRLSVAQFRGDWRETGGGIPPVALLTLVWPNFRHVLEPGKYTGQWDITFMYLYCGVLPLALAMAACFRPKTRFVPALFALLSVSCLGMLGDSTPIGKWFFLLLPDILRGPLYPPHWMALFTLALAALSGFGLQALIRPGKLSIVIVALTALELVAVSSGRPFNTALVASGSGVTQESFEGSKELLATVRHATASQFPPSRIDTYGDSLNWVEGAPLTEVPTAGGYDPLALVRYMQVRFAFADGRRWGSYYEVDHPASPVLGALNVRYLIARNRLPAEALNGSGFRLLGELPGHTWYENQQVLSRFYFTARVIPVASPEEALAVVRNPGWKPLEAAAVEAPRALVATLAGAGSVQVRSYTFNTVSLQTSTVSKAFLVSSEAHYPGWRAWIDGRKVPVYFCNGAFRGIVVPAGTHIVIFRFLPVSLLLGTVVTAFSWFAWGVICMRTWHSRHVDEIRTVAALKN